MIRHPARMMHELSSRALRYLHAHREYAAFGPTPASAGLAGDGAEYKALGETVLAASLALNTGAVNSEESSMARDLAEFCWQQVGEGDLLYERLLLYPYKSDPIELYGHFTHAGYRHSALERLSTHIASLRSFQSAEILPNRRLSVANSVQLLGLNPGAGEYDRMTLAQRTWLGNEPEPWHIDWYTAYAVTHTVFHLTDWGRAPSRMPSNLTAYLHEWLPVWIDVWLETGQWDLIGEFMMVANCLPAPYSDPAVWERLVAVQHSDGMLPRDDRPVDEDPVTRFRDHQHPTIVAVAAGVLGSSRALENPSAA